MWNIEWLKVLLEEGFDFKDSARVQGDGGPLLVREQKAFLDQILDGRFDPFPILLNSLPQPAN